MISFAALLLLSCIGPSGPRITAGDLAPAVPALRQVPASAVLGYAPRPGVTRTFTWAELSRHLPPDHGSKPAPEPVCVAWQMARPDPEAFRVAMQSALAPEAQLAILETSQNLIPPGPIHFPASNLRPATSGQGATWRGYVEYVPGLRYEIWARVDVRVAADRVVTVQDISPGTLIAPDMVRLEPFTTSAAQAGFASRLEDVVGRPARRALRAGTAVPANALGKHTDVQKGDTVRIKVNAGSATIGVEATALAPAAAGEIIPVRVNDTGRTVRARISGPGEATIQLTGGN
ncbi:MAG: flagellar basal body P-ring formation chaperone FlgA [Bryobacteraceae bacterium]|nr:flagellar basal body P-ring formation chaperone FlgA [Bryobacteraceae bacterium]